MDWNIKLVFSILIDLFDMTVGRALFAVPFSSEILGIIAGVLMFGPKGFFYALEALDPTEQIDGFVPTATFIALSAKDD